MMPFAEKLTFLMHITETSNKELAAELSVDPSMISLMRTGKRKLSKNPAQAKKMALFFARRCPAAFQRQALSEMLGQVSISTSMPTEVLADRLESWLQGESGSIADAVLSGIRTFPSLEESAQAPFPAPAPAPEGQTLFFYGEEGRREVMTRVMQELQHMEAPGSILTVVDDNLEWLLSDYLLMRKIQAGFMELSKRGFTFYQIMPPLNYINRYTESLQFWLPIYVMGQTKVYYYPRLRGNLYRHSVIVVPGRCVQYAASVGVGSTSDITMFSTDPKLVKAFEKQFQEHLALCRPSLNVLRTPNESIPRFLEFFSRQGDTIQEVNSLSINSMPRELLEQLVRDAPRPSRCIWMISRVLKSGSARIPTLICAGWPQRRRSGPGTSLWPPLPGLTPDSCAIRRRPIASICGTSCGSWSGMRTTPSCRCMRRSFRIITCLPTRAAWPWSFAPQSRSLYWISAARPWSPRSGSICSARPTPWGTAVSTGKRPVCS